MIDEIIHGGIDRSELIHHGVKGMRWGLRKSPQKQERKNNAKIMKAKTKADYRDRNSIHKLSDSELRSKINRMQMESTYMKLSSERAQYHQSAGRKILRKLKINPVTVAKNNSLAIGTAATSVTGVPAFAAAGAIIQPKKKKKGGS